MADLATAPGSGVSIVVRKYSGGIEFKFSGGYTTRGVDRRRSSLAFSFGVGEYFGGELSFLVAERLNKGFTSALSGDCHRRGRERAGRTVNELALHNGELALTTLVAKLLLLKGTTELESLIEDDYRTAASCALEYLRTPRSVGVERNNLDVGTIVYTDFGVITVPGQTCNVSVSADIDSTHLEKVRPPAKHIGSGDRSEVGTNRERGPIWSGDQSGVGTNQERGGPMAREEGMYARSNPKKNTNLSNPRRRWNISGARGADARVPTGRVPHQQ
eukprot:7602262-Pyramimonas_sp.AAC.1